MAVLRLMEGRSHFWKWVNGFLLVVCLGLWNLDRELNGRRAVTSGPGVGDSSSASPDRSQTGALEQGDEPPNFGPGSALHRPGRGRGSEWRLRGRISRENQSLRSAPAVQLDRLSDLQSPPLARLDRDPFRFGFKPPKPDTSAGAPAVSRAQATLPLEPALTTLKPLGYVEKADGRIEAIVGDEDQVYLVHEGETFASRYRVLRISPLAVEVVDQRPQASQAALLVPPSNSTPTPDSEPKLVASSSPLLPVEPVLRRKDEKSTGAGAAVRPKAPRGPQFQPAATARAIPNSSGPAASALAPLSASRWSSSRETIAPRTTPKPLGYVEKADGQVTGIVADENQVYLIPQGVAIPGMSSLPKYSPPTDQAPDESRKRSSQAILPKQEFNEDRVFGSPPKVEAFSSSELKPVETVAVRKGEELPGFEPAVGLGRPIDVEARPPPADPYLSETQTPETAVSTAAHGDWCAEASFPSPEPASARLEPLGYVERANGQVEVILADEDQVYLVHEGEVLRDKSSKVKTCPSSVQTGPESPPPTTQQGSPTEDLKSGQAAASAPPIAVSHSPPACSGGGELPGQGGESTGGEAAGEADLGNELQSQPLGRFDPSLSEDELSGSVARSGALAGQHTGPSRTDVTPCSQVHAEPWGLGFPPRTSDQTTEAPARGPACSPGDVSPCSLDFFQIGCCSAPGDAPPGPR